MSVIYVTGKTPDGKLLVGGLWTFWEQEGFPLKFSHLHLTEGGKEIDWMEVMADASRGDNLPALVSQMEHFLSTETINDLKRHFAAALMQGRTAEEIVADKRAGGIKAYVAKSE